MNVHFRDQVFLTITSLFLLPVTMAAQQPTMDGLPLYSGKGKISEAVDTQKGAVLDIGGGYMLILPKGIPIGHSRLLTLKFSTSTPPPSLVAKGFKRHGRTLHFDGAISAPEKPILVSLKIKSPPKRPGQKFVLALEQAGLCDENNRQYKLKNGLCSTFTIFDTEYDHAGKRVLAKLSQTGGLRMQFGWLPASKSETE